MLQLGVTMDSEGMVVGWSPLAHGLFGYSQTEADGRSLGELIVPAAFRPYHEAGLRRYVQTREPQCVGHVVEIEAMHRDGHTVAIQLQILPREEGEALFFEAHMAGL